jgi:hypothetical protein
MLIGGSSAPDVKRAAKLSFGFGDKGRDDSLVHLDDVEQNLSFRPPLLDDLVCRGPGAGSPGTPAKRECN